MLTEYFIALHGNKKKDIRTLVANFPGGVTSLRKDMLEAIQQDFSMDLGIADSTSAFGCVILGKYIVSFYIIFVFSCIR